jgi:hypothetical protein
MKLLTHLIIAILFLATSSAQAQAFRKEVDQFKKEDSLKTPPVNAVLFIGSSSFTIWKDMADYFPTHTVFNRAFGGSTLLDQLYYAHEVIFKYQPKQIILYCGENDLASSDAVNADSVYNRFVRLYSIIRNKWPKMPFLYVSMKPSPSRKKYMPIMLDANARISAFLKGKKNADFIDVYNKMLNEDGSFKPEIYLSDSLHMNKKGYAIWQPILEKYLK